jgi:DNA-binding NarL/FixJ family response regulator
MRIILADDHKLFREALRVVLETVPGYEVVAEVGDAPDLKEAVSRLQPDLVIQDYRMPGGGTVAVLEYIKQRYPEIKVIMLTGVDSGALFQQLLDSNADGVLLKEISAEETLASIKQVMSGRRALSSSVSERALPGRPDLTTREFQIMELVVEGLNSTEISARLNLSPKTVENHRYSLMKKLDLKNTVELVHYVRKHGLLEN